jgi:ubiquinone/menaquinone biosynthesis C-methylase UbiE
MSQQISFETFSGSAAENYERYFVPAIGGPLAAQLVDLAALRPGERVLDVACGTGVVARHAAERVGATGTVVGIDINPGMLAVARAATPAAAATDWYEASADKLPLPDETFDVAFCSLGLQFFPDKRAALGEMRRVLVSGGRLLVSVPGPTPPLFAVLEDALARHLGPDAAAFVVAVFSLHDPAEIGDLVSSAGFEKVEVWSSTTTLRLPRPEDFLWQYVHSTPLGGAAAQLDDQRRTELQSEVVAGWQPLVEDGTLSLELGTTLATARK